jgi:hypothetical protein
VYTEGADGTEGIDDHAAREIIFQRVLFRFRFDRSIAGITGEKHRRNAELVEPHNG